MTRDDAAELLAPLVASTSDPALDEDALAALLDGAAVPDGAGLLPTDNGWAGAWDLNIAASRGWRQKAALVAERFEFSADGASYKRDQVFQHFLAMADHYAGLGTYVVGDTDPDSQQRGWTATRTIYTANEGGSWWEGQVP